MAKRSPSGSLEVAWRSTASGEVVRIHAAAVVDDADQPAAAALDNHVDPGRAGIERVLNELLDGGGRALDDLARGDPIHEHG